MENQLPGMTAKIVSAFVQKNEIAPDLIGGLIRSVYDSLTHAGKPHMAAPPQRLTPAVPIRRSVSDATIICLDCGYAGQMIKRHLMTAHGLTPDQYRDRWALPREYPMLAKNYSARRSELAKNIGLGTMRMRQPIVAEPQPPPPPPAPTRKRTATAKPTGRRAAPRRRKDGGPPAEQTPPAVAAASE
jgi:predicted transcriptional regulator